MTSPLHQAAREAKEALEKIVNGPWPPDVDGPEAQCRWDLNVARPAHAALTAALQQQQGQEPMTCPEKYAASRPAAAMPRDAKTWDELHPVPTMSQFANMAD